MNLIYRSYLNMANVIGCVAAYTSGSYVYFNNMIDKAENHYIVFIFNQRNDMYITSPLNILDENFVSLPKPFV